MAGRPLLRKLRSHNETICRTCRLAIRQRPTQQRIVAAYSTKTTSKLPVDDAITRKPSRFELKQYLERIKSLQNPSKDGNESFSVRFFEQDDKKRTELPGEDAWGASFNEVDTSGLKDALLEIKDDIGGKDEKDAFQNVVDQLGTDWHKMKTADDLERIIAKLDAYTAAVDKEIDKTGADLPKELLEKLDSELPGLPGMGSLGSRITLPQIPEKPWTINQRKKVARLNTVLSKTARDYRRGVKLTTKTVQGVFKAYHSARLSLAHGWSHVPLEVWDLLWKVFSVDESVNMHRLSHIALLARDMSEAKVTLNPAQQLLTIEAVFVDGWESKAIENWKRCISTLGDENAVTFQEFWELGVRMYCRTGDLEQAQRAINKLIQNQSDPRILMPFIRTWSELGTQEGQEKAWDAYRRLRELLGEDMKLTDYDQVISYFLTTNQTENALYAFVDMMSDGKIDLKKQKYLPSVVANKFFFGKWLKRLIGAGDLHGAHSVVAFMGEKGIDPSPIQLNGLIAAWQRAGGTEDLEKADEMAWGMIDTRIEFVKARGNDAALQDIPSINSGAIPLPRATLETFSLLAENYRLRDLHDRILMLWEAFREAEMKADSFVINQLLESYIQAGQSKEALELYHTLVREKGVEPDPYTFSALWKTLAVNRLHVSAGHVPAQIEPTRAMFAETVKFQHVFQPDGMDGQLARKILHTFRRIKDYTGFVVALTALRDGFGFLPPETLVLEMVLQTTKLSWDSPAHRRRLMNTKRDLDRDLAASVDGDLSRLEDSRRGEALFEYLQKQFWPSEGDNDFKRKMFKEAAEQMGVYDMMRREVKQ
ncbi:Ff.00g096390.m01.CDS01 [Fusarium sp. VM40]|nr:Ff.00g096390.m01.CDS01 [Fusarium sp. VM40]